MAIGHAAGCQLELIEEALGSAISVLAEDAQIEKAIRDEGLIVDRDTQGVPGVPPIVDTIFNKIDAATIFVPDLTFVGKRVDGRPTPNPNVLVEYGWALNALGYNRIVPVMNMAFGEPTPETMPFDMRHLRHPKCTYNLPEGASDEQRRSELARLVGSLAAEIGDVLRKEGLRREKRTPFPAAEPKDGQARFRAKGEPLGTAHQRPVTLEAGPAMWLRVMPELRIDRKWHGTEIRDFAKSNDNHLVPLGIEAFLPISTDHMFAENGFGIYVVHKPIQCIVFVFETGEIWGIDAYHLTMGTSIPLIEPYLIKALTGYSAFLRERLGVPPPYRWIAGIEGVKGRPIEIPVNAPGQVIIQRVSGSCLSDEIVKSGTHEQGADAQTSLRPFFVELFAKCMISRPDWMDSFVWPSMPY
jgi:hypothetical protein